MLKITNKTNNSFVNIDNFNLAPFKSVTINSNYSDHIRNLETKGIISVSEVKTFDKVLNIKQEIKQEYPKSSVLSEGASTKNTIDNSFVVDSIKLTDKKTKRTYKRKNTNNK